MIRIIFLPSLFLAYIWTWIWGTYRFIKYWNKIHPRWRIDFAYHWGRHESPRPTICDCGWMGPMRFLIHTYASYGEDDVEPVDKCPKCGDEVGGNS
ncbi:hypothetical protein KKF61_07120 [Patescibacteria group bacterium]|nr:hypothetical protein [Patescibacteria group bacterium]